MKMYVDASTKLNGQPGQDTEIVVVGKTGRVVHQEHLGDRTVNEGELAAIYRAIELGGREILSDSKLAVGWANKGRVGKKAPHLARLALKTHQLIAVTGASVSWIPREQNLAGHHFEAKQRQSYRPETAPAFTTKMGRRLLKHGSFAIGGPVKTIRPAKKP